VLVGYDVRRGYSGSFRDINFDLHKFVGHEVMVTLVAFLLREKHWDLLADLLSREILVKGPNGDKMRRFDDLSSHLKLLTFRKERLKTNRVSVHADILKDRHESGELGRLLPFSEFMEADYFLLLRGEIALDSRFGHGWFPRSAAFLEHADPPRYLREAERRASAEAVAKALGVPNAAELRDRLTAAKPKLQQIFVHDSPFWEGPLKRFDVSAVGTR
ncbi:MAG: hypothetical protein OK454_02585, partial [Thaumarchaeota archaeon]|nr:hypothetical protein [Nitrososphaerota archaeon]